MRIISIAIPLGFAFADPCTDLCQLDGPAVCTGGSWTKGAVCHGYLFRGDPANGDYCYHTAANASTCPANGVAMRPQQAAAIVARRRNDDVRGFVEISVVQRPVAAGPAAVGAAAVQDSSLSMRNEHPVAQDRDRTLGPDAFAADNRPRTTNLRDGGFVYIDDADHMPPRDPYRFEYTDIFEEDDRRPRTGTGFPADNYGHLLDPTRFEFMDINHRPGIGLPDVLPSEFSEEPVVYRRGDSAMSIGQH